MKRITLGGLVPNPFKKHILNGRIDEEKVKAIKQSASKTSFWENWVVRKHGDEYQLVFGHHRLQAALDLYGVAHRVSVQIVAYTDEQMAIALVNENATQTEHYQEREDVIRLFRDNLRSGNFKCQYLSGDRTGIKGSLKKHECGSVNCVLAALGENVWSRTVVGDTLSMIDSLDNSVKVYVDIHGHEGSSNREPGTISVTAAKEIRRLPKEVQVKVFPLVAVQGPTPRNSFGRVDSGLRVYAVKEALAEVKAGADPIATFTRVRRERDDEFLKDGNSEANRLTRKIHSFQGELGHGWVPQELIAFRDSLDELTRTELISALMDLRDRCNDLAKKLAMPEAKKLSVTRSA